MEADRFESLPRANQRALLWYHCCVLLARIVFVLCGGIPLILRWRGASDTDLWRLTAYWALGLLAFAYIMLELVLEQLRRIASRVPDGPASGER